MIQESIERAIALTEEEMEAKATRELALVRTKLEEAEQWLEAARNGESRQVRRAAARKLAQTQN